MLKSLAACTIDYSLSRVNAPSYSGCIMVLCIVLYLALGFRGPQSLYFAIGVPHRS